MPSISTFTELGERSATVVAASALATAGAGLSSLRLSWPGAPLEAGSDAGKLSAIASSWASATCSSACSPIISASAERNPSLDSESETRSCGRLGPASDGTTSERSSSIVSEKVGSSELSSCHRPCSFA